jgi:ABC-type nitrate/sulfonate/bicarbonate transport system substrate-binding protein
MGALNRRDFLKRGGAGAGSVLALGSVSTLLAACGGDDEEGSASTGGGPGKVTNPKIGLSSNPQASYPVVLAGPILYGAEFGIKGMTRDDITIFDSSTTLTQSALSGQVDVAGQSTTGHLLLIDKGQPFKIFCPYILSDDFVIASRGDVTELSQLKDSGVVVAVDSPGGAGQTIFDAMLLANNAGFLTSDLPKTVVIESSGERASALASGDCDVTVIHLPQANEAKQQAGKINILSKLYGEVPHFLKEGYAARTDWLDKNLETAAALTASVIKASREMAASYDTFAAGVGKVIDEPPEAAELKELHGLAGEYDFWPQDGGLDDERVQFMIDLAKREGLLKGDLTIDAVVDRRPLERAMELLGS